MNIHEQHTRSWIKALTWRAIASLTVIILTYLFTGAIDTALQIGALDVVIKLVLYYLHERAWNRVSWGRDAHHI